MIDGLRGTVGAKVCLSTLGCQADEGYDWSTDPGTVVDVNAKDIEIRVLDKSGASDVYEPKNLVFVGTSDEFFRDIAVGNGCRHSLSVGLTADAWRFLNGLPPFRCRGVLALYLRIVFCESAGRQPKTKL